MTSDDDRDPDLPQSWNRYAYALDNPVTNTDPTGLIAAVPQGCVGMPTADPTTGDYYMCPDDGGFPGRQQLWVDPDDGGGGGGGGGGGVESYDPGPPGPGPSGPGGGNQITTQPPKGPVCVSAAAIDAVLANTPMAGEGQDFYNAGQEYNVNHGLAVAIAGAESTFGENTNTTWGYYNAWGWGNSPSLHAIAQGWTNWNQGILKVSWQLGSSTLYLGAQNPLTTTAAIYGNWCTAGNCAGGLSTINSILGELGVGPTSSLRFAACTEEGQ